MTHATLTHASSDMPHAMNSSGIRGSSHRWGSGTRQYKGFVGLSGLYRLLLPGC